MTIYLRTKDNETVADIELWESDDCIDIRCAIIIPQYSKLLLSVKDKKTCIDDFDRLSELRGWYWEVYTNQHDIVEIDGLIEAVLQLLEYFRDTYSLQIITD